MEGFAQGIQCMIAGDWLGLTYVFRDVGMCPAGSFYRKERVDGKKVETPCPPEEMAEAIETCLMAEEGGQSRFGALATGLGAMSSRYKFLTPPYIVLLVRTFLTLEGIAAKADPDFNIYTASLPVRHPTRHGARHRGGTEGDARRVPQRARQLHPMGTHIRTPRPTIRGGRRRRQLRRRRPRTKDGIGDGKRHLPRGDARSRRRRVVVRGSRFGRAMSASEAALAASSANEELDALRPMARAEMLTEVMDTAAAAAAADSVSDSNRERAFAIRVRGGVVFFGGAVPPPGKISSPDAARRLSGGSSARKRAPCSAGSLTTRVPYPWRRISRPPRRNRCATRAWRRCPCSAACGWFAKPNAITSRARGSARGTGRRQRISLARVRDGARDSREGG